MLFISFIVKNRIIVTGNIVEFYSYSKGYLSECQYKPKGREFGSISSDDSKPDGFDRLRALNRAKRNLRRLINANHQQYGSSFTSKFLTLTFKENITCLDFASYELEKFIKRLNYRIYQTNKANLRYVCVPEFQERGAVHYHLVIFNMPYFRSDILSDLWGNGFIKINQIEDVDNVGVYISAYLGGEDEFDTRLQGRKSYHCSRGLLKPVEIIDKKKVEQIAAALLEKKPIYSTEFESDYLGNVVCMHYSIKSF